MIWVATTGQSTGEYVSPSHTHTSQIVEIRYTNVFQHFQWIQNALIRINV